MRQTAQQNEWFHFGNWGCVILLLLEWGYGGLRPGRLRNLAAHILYRPLGVLCLWSEA